VVETAATVVRVGVDGDAAQHWIDWDNPIRTPWTVKACFAAIPADVGNLYGWYRVLCAAKHTNPVLQREVPASLTEVAHLLNA
jgi:hypothetical protein